MMQTKRISGFTFIHNAIQGGYPLFEAIYQVKDFVDEIVVIDMESTDLTRPLLNSLFSDWHFSNRVGGGFPQTKIINGRWGNQAGETLRQAHNLYKACSGDIILHFEADEVYDTRLLQTVKTYIANGVYDIAVHRLQLEQNFQRCRWYPEPIHRVWPKETDTIKEGHTTNRHNEAKIMLPEDGFLWDITNCFRNNWLNRVRNQAELWHGTPRYVMVPLHTTQESDVNSEDLNKRLWEPHWEWTVTPFDIPDILKPLVGETKYEPTYR